MKNSRQHRTPICEALQELKKRRLVPFDVPGHKRGQGNPELANFLGDLCLSLDVNSMKPLDNLCHPKSVIKEAEDLAAEAFGADYAFFMVGGTTSSVQAMIMSVCQRGDKLIIPRNVHRSAINALILCGAEPVYINPEIHEDLGISLGMSLTSLKQALKEHPEAKAVFVNNPTYYGVCSNLEAIVELAQAHGLKVLVDEAHGAHFYFGQNLPLSAMAAGADLAAVSMHKSGGSLTQSSFLLGQKSINPDHVRQIINLTQTTSGSYLLLSSLDISRKMLALDGHKIFANVLELASYARREINQIDGYYAFGQEIINGDSIFDFDATKLSINTLNTGLAGIEVYDLLRDEYDIQIEFGDLGNILAYVSMGDNEKKLERLISALSEIQRRYKRDKGGLLTHEYITPIVELPPQAAFYAPKVSVSLEGSLGRISGEFVMCYPPGIPVLTPGERVTQEIIEYIKYAKEKGCFLTGTEDSKVEHIMVIDSKV